MGRDALAVLQAGVCSSNCRLNIFQFVRILQIPHVEVIQYLVDKAL